MATVRDLLGPYCYRSAHISACGRYRYSLVRRWDDGPTLAFVMLNPSTADASIDDNTIRRCAMFAHDQGFKAIHVVNLFAYRATDPNDLMSRGFLVGVENREHIDFASAIADEVCVAWGGQAGHPTVRRQAQTVLRQLDALHVVPLCLHITRRGHPGHPLRLAQSCRLRPFQRVGVYA